MEQTQGQSREGAVVPFELKLDEVQVNLTLSEGGGKLRVAHIFKPPTLEDWLAYDAALQVAHERDEKEFVRWTDHREEAAAILWDRVAVRVEGYWPQPGPSASPQDDLPVNWKARVPANHKAHGAAVFAEVHAVEDDDVAVAFLESEVSVRIAARRGETYHEHLVHRFRRPNAPDRSRWKRAHAGAYLARDGKIERSLLPGRLRDQVEFYREFVLSVEGYSVEGRPVTREDALIHMDAQHASTAIRGLFNA